MSYMKLAIEQGKKGSLLGELPVGAVIVKDNNIISMAHNEKEMRKDPTAHAEILAIQRAIKVTGDWRLNEAELYVTLEPCPMCASAIAQSRIKKIYIGTYNKEMGACGTILNLVNNKYIGANVEVEWLYDDECSSLLSDFFTKRREK